MMRSGCDDVERLIDREAQGLSEAERLRVEQHIGECASCRENLAIARFVRDTIENARPALSDVARERAIARALAQTGATEAHGTRKRKVVLLSSLAAVSAVAAAVLLVVFAGRPTPVAEVPRTHEPSPGVLASEASQAPLAPRVEPTWVEVEQEEQRTFAHAKVKLRPTTRVRFDAERATLALDRGEVVVDVDVSRGRSFAVTTQHFRVEVLGTRFVVTPTTVAVERGRVQVYGVDGSVLARDLSAGASFSYGAASSPTKGDEAERREAHMAEVSARVWLGKARDALARGNTKSAKELIARAEASEPSRADRAEASTLRAEAALLERDGKTAVRFYLSVARRFPDLAAGENAAFAAAQIAARVEPARERALLQSYLKQYPRGRFKDEVERRLVKLDAAP